MKKFFLATALLLSTYISFSQIPNANMELWDNQPVLLYWETNSRPLTLPPWEPYIVRQDSDSYSGTWSANLFANGIFKAYATACVPLAYHPTSLSLYYKTIFAPCVNDSGFPEKDTVSVLIEVLNNGSVVDQGYWEGFTTSLSYTQLVVPISQNATTFDSCRITLMGGMLIGGCGIIAASTEFKVDHLELKYSSAASCIDSSLICPTCICTAVYDPVCGCDGYTYINSCVAYTAGVTSWSQGACGTMGCIDSSAICDTCPCPAVYNPVCGCDGITYDNPCFASNAGVHNWTSGRCGTTSCVANFYYSGNTIAPVTIQYQDASTGANITNWEWTFSDGTVSNQQNPQVTYSVAGIYTACLRITSVDTSGSVCVDSICQSVFIDDSSSLSCIDQSLVCDTCPCPGIYDPVCGCDGITYDNDCMAQNAGVVRYSPGPCGIINPCDAYFYYWSDTSGYIVHFEYASGWIPNPSSPDVQLLWNFGDGTTSTDQSPVHTYLDTSIHSYPVCLTVTDTAQNCTSTYCDSIYVDQIVRGCYAGFGYTIDSTGVVMVYPDSSGSEPSGIWVWGNDTTSIDPNPSFQLDSNSNYNICYIVMNDSMQCTDTVCLAAAQLYAEFLAMGFSPINPEIKQVYLYPNPASDLSELRFTTNKQGLVSIAMRNLLGEIIYQLPAANLPPGSYAYSLQLGHFSSGVYLVEIKLNNSIAAVRRLSKQ